MGQIKLWQSSFNAGELTPLLEAREDLQKYPNGCRRLRNFHGIIQGPARRRAGSRRVANSKSNGQFWLIPFIKGRNLAYVIELGDNYARFYKNRGQILKTTTGSGLDDSFTKALLHMDGADASTFFGDESGKIWTANGNVQIDTAEKKFGSASALFDGTGDFISTPDHADFALGSGDWTFDAWFNCTGLSTTGGNICGQGDAAATPGATSFFLGRNAVNQMVLRVSDGVTVGTLDGVTSFTNLTNPGWHHIAAVRSGNTLMLFVDGILEGQAAFTGSVQDSAETFTIGARSAGGGSMWTGWIDELRFSKGVARWTTDFIPPGPYGNVPYEIVTPWTYADLTDVDGTFKFRLVQSLDVIFVCGGTGIKQINHFADDNWTVTDFDTVGGPFDATNITPTTVYASAATGTVTLTASTAIFTSDRIGSLMLLRPQNLSSVKPWEANTITTTNALRRSDGKTYKQITAGVTENTNGQVHSGTVAPIHEEGIASDGGTGAKIQDTNQTTAARVTTGYNWEFQDPGYGIVKITAVGGGGTTATAVVQPWRLGANAQLPDATVLVGNATSRWAWGLFSNANGWPKVPTFFRERFVLATSRKIAFSVPSSYNEFVQETAGELLPDNAFVVDIQADRDEDLQWMLPSSVLHVGTTGAEHIVTELTTQQVFGPENRKIEPHTGFGSNGVAPLRVGDSPLFVDASALRVRAIELGDNGRYTANSQNDLAEHITQSGIIQTTWAALPDQLYWGVRVDGRLACLTFSREQDVFGWSQHFVGGYRDNSRLQAAKVRTLCSIPSPDGTIDEVWLGVERWINGQLVRWIEFFTEALKAPQQWENETSEAFKRRLLDFQAEGFFVDGGVTFDEPQAISNISISGGGVITVTSQIAHALVDGDEVRIDEVMGTWEVNAYKFIVNSTGTKTFELVDVDGSNYTPYASGGVFRKLETVITNLSPYEGQEVQVLTDGAVHPDRTVSGGQIELQYGAGRVHIGFGYKSLIETERPAGGADDGSAQGQLGAVNRLIVRMSNSLGGRIGPNEDLLDDIQFRSPGDAMDLPPPLFSGDKEQGWPDGFSTDRTVVFVQDQPLPSTIEGFGLDMEVNS